MIENVFKRSFAIIKMGGPGVSEINCRENRTHESMGSTSRSLVSVVPLSIHNQPRIIRNKHCRNRTKKAF